MSKEKRDFKGVWIPKEIYLNKNLSWTEKILLIEIDSLDNGEGCYAGNKHFSEFLGKKQSYIGNLISKLLKDGWLEKRKFDGRKRYISLHKNVKAGFTKMLKQLSQKSDGQNDDNSQKTPSNKEKKGLTTPPNNTTNNTTNTNVLSNDNHSAYKKDNSTKSGNSKENDDSTEGEFYFPDKINQLLNSKNRQTRIMATFFKRKNLDFERKEHYEYEFKKQIKAAKQLNTYKDEDILKAIDHCESKYDEWNLHTVVKVINYVKNNF